MLYTVVMDVAIRRSPDLKQSHSSQVMLTTCRSQEREDHKETHRSATPETWMRIWPMWLMVLCATSIHCGLVLLPATAPFCDREREVRIIRIAVIAAEDDPDIAAEERSH